MLGAFKAASATQSEAALMLDFSTSLRACAKVVVATKATMIPNVTGRYVGILTLSVSASVSVPTGPLADQAWLLSTAP